MSAPTPWLRRARPLLGTLVEIGVPEHPDALAWFACGFARLSAVQASLSRFEPESEVSRFHALPPGGVLDIGDDARCVLRAAHWLREHSQGRFDISLGSAPQGWALNAAGQWCKHDAATRLDLGGLAKGHAVDVAVRALQAAGCPEGWVNAGGDVRVFGAVAVPIQWRDEQHGGTRALAAWPTLRQAALATSHFAPGSRSTLHTPDVAPAWAHVSVVAPECLWADALTKLAAQQLPSASAPGWWHDVVQHSQAQVLWHATPSHDFSGAP